MASEEKGKARKKMVTLRCSDGEEFRVAATACAVSQTISWAIDSRRDDEDPAVVPLCNVDGATFARIRDYMVKHRELAARPKGTSAADADAAKKERRAWEAQFMDVDTDTLYRLLLASNYLEIQELEDLCATRAANLMMGKEPEEIRKLLNIKNDFTPEEGEENRKQNKWLWDY